jgi:nicotinate-nucleotide--dimethylbenzimidazole phosphoribosyltransferase
MLGSFANNWAVITALAKNQRMDMVVMDMGVKGEAIPSKKIVNKKIAAGTKNFLKEDAMSREELEKAVAIGMALAEETKAKGYDIVLIGEMGIGNTTSASAITALLLSLPVKVVTGRGTGVSDQAYLKKIQIITKAIQERKVKKSDAMDVLQKVGGFEIAAMTGFLLKAAAVKLPVLLDGFITGAAALAAFSIAPQAKQYWIAGHVSKEIGHRKILEKLSLRPILDLDLRLGEASGAALALPILEQAIAISRDTGTFTLAGVANKE